MSSPTHSVLLEIAAEPLEEAFFFHKLRSELYSYNIDNLTG